MSNGYLLCTVCISQSGDYKLPAMGLVSLNLTAAFNSLTSGISQLVTVVSLFYCFLWK